MAGIYEKADLLEAKNQKIKTDKARNAIFERLISILKQNFAHQGLTTKTVALKAGSGLEAHFGNIAYEVNFKEIVYDDFIQEAKQFIVRITLQQIACHVMSEDTIRFSITEDHLKTFKNKFEELTFEQFLKDPTRPRVKPVKKEIANPENEIVASSNSNSTLKQKTTEMTNTATATQNDQKPTTLEELLVFMENFLNVRGYEHGPHYKNIEIDEVYNRIAFKANTPAIRQEIEGTLTKANLPYERPTAENTKTLWFKLAEVKLFTNEFKKEIQVYLKGKKVLNVLINRFGMSVHFRSNKEMKAAYDFMVNGKVYKVEPVDRRDPKSFWITGKLKTENSTDEIVKADSPLPVAKTEPITKVDKPNSELSKEEQDKLKELRSDINYDLLLSGKFNYKNYNLGPLGSKQNFVVANCGAFVEPILEFLQQSYNVKKSPRGNKALWIFGKKDSEPELIIQNDLDAQEATEDDADRKQFKSSISSLENLFELYVLQKKEIVELNEKLAISSGYSEKDIFLGLTKLYQDLVAGGGDLMVRLRQPDDSEIMNRIDLEKFLKYFANVFIENKE
ncbi:MAG: hypothetical protein QG566_354 [Patescibacteria group bacterium]|nr:hypothetical protein [Patescibacteria group bacterium]